MRIIKLKKYIYINEISEYASFYLTIETMKLFLAIFARFTWKK